jgi:hypothetical protein
MKDWIMELCPEIAEWQADLIVEYAQRMVEAERESCAELADMAEPFRSADAIRGRKYLEARILRDSKIKED